MKVKQNKKSEFYPITITLETEEEADFMWHNLNRNYTESLEDYCKERDIDINRLSGFKNEIWNLLDGIYAPGEKDHQ